MAFMGMMIGLGAFIIFCGIVLLMLGAFGLTLILKIINRKKQDRKLRIVSNIFLVFGILFELPVIAIIGFLTFEKYYTKVTLPDGDTKYVRRSDVKDMQKYAKDGDADELDRLLDKKGELIYSLDANYDSVLDYGLINGDAGIVEVAIDHGAVFDDPKKYDHMAYISCSMEAYLNSCINHSITQDDVKILKLMFEKGAKTELKSSNGNAGYSNALGAAAWAVLYNDDTVTDTELEFLQVIADNGFPQDSSFLTIDELPSNHHVSSSYRRDVVRDDNYFSVMKIVGKNSG